MEHTCTRCGDLITGGARWEYTQGAPRYGEAETAPRIHSQCVAELLREVIACLARVPEHEREAFSIEI